VGFARTYRVIEGSLVTLFFLQAARVVFAVLLKLTAVVLEGGPFNGLLAIAVVGLLLAAVAPALAPRARSTLPGLLMFAAMGTGAARLIMAVSQPEVQLVGALAVLALGGVYIAALLGANWQRWVGMWIAALVLDQFMRIGNTYDLSLRPWLFVPALGVRLAVPGLAVQAVLSALLIVVSRLARRAARHEPYWPAHLTLAGGAAVGGFLALQMLALALPGAVGRWTGVPHSAISPWFVLATVLPLSGGVRRAMSETLNPFAERLRGWVWLMILLILLVVGNRLDGPGAVSALVAAQFMTVLLLWWLPLPGEPRSPRGSRAAFSLGMLVFAALVTLYGLAFEYMHGLGWLRNQGLLVLLLAAGLLALPRLLPRVADPWLAPPALPRGVAATFIAPVFVLALVISGAGGAQALPAPGPTLRVATYNINGGYDAQGVYQLEAIARTIEAASPDVVLLQEVDAGHPAAYGADQVTVLAKRLGMYAVYYPTVEQLRGLAILSRWPLAEAGGLLLPGDGEQLGAQRARLALGGETVVLVNTRLVPASEETRLEQVAVLLGLLEQGEPAVLAGDFGTALSEQEMRQVSLLGITDPNDALGIEGGYTVPAAAPTARHDFILVRDLTPLDARQVQSAASDHRLVVVEVERVQAEPVGSPGG